MNHLFTRAVCAAAAAVCTTTATGAQQVPAAAPHTGEVWRIVAQPQSSLVFARDGSLIGEIGKEWRSNVPLRTLPPYVGQAFVAVEDQRFYKHDGVDLVGVAGALKDNLLGGSRGASTITQQLVGNMHPDIIDRTDKSLGRKLHEQQAAREMEKHYNKEQILEAYLNQILFGHGWYGIESAAQHYFGKGASKLTLAEAATLAALPKGPAIYDPIKYPDRARQRRDVVLTLMAEQKYITPEAAAAAKRETLRVAPNGGMSVRAPYFVDAVKTQLERAGVNVSEGGYRVYTTVDPVLQAAAQASLTAGVAAVEARPDYKHPTPARHAAGVTDFLEGAFIAMSPETGDVLAMVGGRDYVTAPYNRAVNGMRQPGSAFKPFVYATAILDSMPANSKVADTAITITYDRQTYQPRNADGEFLGELTMRNALARSRNPVAVQLWEKVGADAVINTARRVGLRSEIAPFPSSAIGASVVQPLNLVSAYTVFANLGSSVEPRLATKVESTDGRTVWSAGVVVRAGALDSNTAFIVRDMLRDVVERGTAASIRRYLPDIPVAGKTGTTDDVTDVWFVGLTPDIVAGVWLGFDRPKTIVAGAAGGTLAAPIFGEALAKWYRGRQPGQWTTPGGLVMAQLDRDSGNLADAATPADRRYSEYFLPGTEPAALRLDVRRLFTWGPIIF